MDTSEYLGLFLEESRESLDILNGSLLLLEHDPDDPETLASIFRVAHSLKGMSASVGLDAMAQLTHRMEDMLAALRDGGTSPGPEVIDALFACLDTLQAMVDAVVCGDETPVDTDAVLAALEAAATAAPAEQHDAPRGAAPPRVEAPAPMVRVAAEHLDALVALAAALAERRARLGALAGGPGALRDEVDGLGREVERLADLVGAIRLTPVEEVFMRFPRMVRDLSQSLGKLVELHIDGGGIAIGRAAADGLAEPLTHALRNAIDHGIEYPGDRVAAGKEPDRGAVPDRPAARTTGWSSRCATTAAGWTRRRCAPRPCARAAWTWARRSRSRTRRPCSWSSSPACPPRARSPPCPGAGVGMDAVRAAVGALGGWVDIASVPGTGSTVTIRLPLAQPSPPS